MLRTAFTKKLESLVPLNAAALKSLLALTIESSAVDRRRPILTAGQTPDYIYVLLDGWAARYELRANGSRRITGFLLPGDFCGIHAVCNAAMDHSVVALTSCRVGRISADAVGELSRKYPSINTAIWRAKLIEEAILRKWLLFASDAKIATAHLLCELYVRAAVVGLTENGRCAVPLTQEELGDALGLTSVHVNRMIRNLREGGSLEFTHQVLIIRDAKRLIEEARFDPTYLHPWRSENAIALLS